MHVLLISKPLCPPWHDSGKNWARDVAAYGGGDQVVHHVLVPNHQGQVWAEHPNVVAEPIYAADGSFSPRLLDNARALRRLVERGRCQAVHFCFAPNPRTNRLARLAMRWRRQPSVHTVLSVPARFEDVSQVLFAERVVCVSRSTADRFIAQGISGVEVIPASIPVPEPLAAAEPARIADIAARFGLTSGRPIVVFPGDYEFSRAADIFAGAIEHLWRNIEADFVFACRIKRKESLRREASIKQRLQAPHQAGRVHFLREVHDMRALLALAQVVTLPAESTYAKMDIPLVLLEALAEQTPVVLADVAPLRETLGDAPNQNGGLLVPPLDAPALANALSGLLRDQRAAAELGQNGRRHVLQHHNAAITCRRYADIYRDLHL